MRLRWQAEGEPPPLRVKKSGRSKSGLGQNILRHQTRRPPWLFRERLKNKYPFNVYMKNWKTPNAAMAVSFFAAFARRHPNVRRFYETLHTLPFRGVGCSFYRSGGQRGWMASRTYVPLQISYAIRPFHGKAVGDVKLHGHTVLRGVQPYCVPSAKWAFHPPHNAPWWHYRPDFPVEVAGWDQLWDRKQKASNE